MEEGFGVPAQEEHRNISSCWVAFAIDDRESAESSRRALLFLRPVLGPARLVVEDETIVALFFVSSAKTPDERLRALARRAGEALSSPKASPPSRWIGVGCSAGENADRAGIARAQERALTALRLGKVIWREPRIVLHRDVWIFDTLSRDRATLRNLAGLLDPLVAYDDEHGTNLVATLEAFSEADLSQIATARRLGVHRHTVGLRLLLAEQILGRSLRTGPDRLLVEFAPKARRLLLRS